MTKQSDIEMVAKARAWAVKAHAGQKDKAGKDYFKLQWQGFPLIHVGEELPHLAKCCEVSILIIKVVTSNADCKVKPCNKIQSVSY